MNGEHSSLHGPSSPHSTFIHTSVVVVLHVCVYRYHTLILSCLSLCCFINVITYSEKDEKKIISSDAVITVCVCVCPQWNRSPARWRTCGCTGTTSRCWRWLDEELLERWEFVFTSSSSVCQWDKNQELVRKQEDVNVSSSHKPPRPPESVLSPGLDYMFYKNSQWSFHWQSVSYHFNFHWLEMLPVISVHNFTLNVKKFSQHRHQNVKKHHVEVLLKRYLLKLAC